MCLVFSNMRLKCCSYMMVSPFVSTMVLRCGSDVGFREEIESILPLPLYNLLLQISSLHQNIFSLHWKKILTINVPTHTPQVYDLKYLKGGEEELKHI